MGVQVDFEAAVGNRRYGSNLNDTVLKFFLTVKELITPKCEE